MILFCNYGPHSAHSVITRVKFDDSFVDSFFLTVAVTHFGCKPASFTGGNSGMMLKTPESESEPVWNRYH